MFEYVQYSRVLLKNFLYGVRSMYHVLNILYHKHRTLMSYGVHCTIKYFVYAYYVLNTRMYTILDVFVYRVRSPNVRYESAFDRSLCTCARAETAIRPPPQPDAPCWLLATPQVIIVSVGMRVHDLAQFRTVRGL